MVGKLSRVILRPIAIQSFQDFPDAGVERTFRLAERLSDSVCWTSAWVN